MKTIKKIMAALICMTIALTGIPISVKAADSSGSMSTEMETNSELFITLEENKDYRWNVNDDAGKSSVVHLDTSEGNNCRFRLDHIEKEWYGIKHIKVNGTEKAGIVLKNGVLPIEALNAAKGTAWAEDVMSLIQKQQIPGLTKWYNAGGKEELESIPGLVPSEKVVYGPLYRNPKRIFGIGLNYADHAGDIGSAAPKGFPGSFFKQADTLIGPDDEILLPKLKEAQKTTAEAELGIIMGKDCRDISEENWQDAIVGYTTILDMTEESILKGNDYVSGNPRYLTIVKNFPTFFSFGPELVTPDEVPDVNELLVQSVHNGEVHAENVVANMTHRPPRLVSLHSSIQGWYAGDILSTGTPRAFHIQDGDVAECRITGPDGFEMTPLVNPVVDLKKHPEKEV